MNAQWAPIKPCGVLWVACLKAGADVPFPPLLLRPWSGHFYAADSFMKHKTWSNTWHEIGNKAEQKGEQSSSRMWSQHAWLDLEADAGARYCLSDWKDMTPVVLRTTNLPQAWRKEKGRLEREEGECGGLGRRVKPMNKSGDSNSRV